MLRTEDGENGPNGKNAMLRAEAVRSKEVGSATPPLPNMGVRIAKGTGLKNRLVTKINVQVGNPFLPEIRLFKTPNLY